MCRSTGIQILQVKTGKSLLAENKIVALMKNHRLIMNAYLGKRAGGYGRGLLLEIILGCRSNQERIA